MIQKGNLLNEMSEVREKGGQGSSASIAAHVHVASPPPFDDVNVKQQEEGHLKHNGNGNPGDTPPPSSSCPVIMLMNSEEWIKEGPKAQDRVLDHLRRNSVNVEVLDKMPAGSYVWVIPRSKEEEPRTATGSEAKASSCRNNDQVLDIIIQRIHYRDAKELLSPVNIADGERFHPMTKFQLEGTKFSYSGISRRIVLLEGTEEDRSLNKELDSHIETIKEIDPALEVHQSSSPKETVKFLKSVHRELSRRATVSSSQVSAGCSYNELKARVQDELSSGIFQLCLALLRHGLDLNRSREFWRVLCTAVSPTKALHPQQTLWCKVTSALIQRGGLASDLAGLITGDLIKAYEKGWWRWDDEGASDMKKGDTQHESPKKNAANLEQRETKRKDPPSMHTQKPTSSLAKRSKPSQTSPGLISSTVSDNSPRTAKNGQGSAHKSHDIRARAIPRTTQPTAFISVPMSLREDILLWDSHKQFCRDWNRISGIAFSGSRTAIELATRWRTNEFSKNVMDIFGRDVAPFTAQDDFLLWSARTSGYDWEAISVEYFCSTQSAIALAKRWYFSTEFEFHCSQAFGHLCFRQWKQYMLTIMRNGPVEALLFPQIMQSGTRT